MVLRVTLKLFNLFPPWPCQPLTRLGMDDVVSGLYEGVLYLPNVYAFFQTDNQIPEEYFEVLLDKIENPEHRITAILACKAGEAQ